MEFVVITFPTQRRVRVDGAVRGQTNQVIRLQAGTHSFDLDTPKDYTPSVVITQVSGTTDASPMIITFMPIAAAVTVTPAAAAAVTETGGKKRATRKKRAASRKTVRKAKPKKKKASKKRPARRPKKRKAARKVR